jgi:hypothetical protein
MNPLVIAAGRIMSHLTFATLQGQVTQDMLKIELISD